jgi:hypothetical protein
VRITSVCPRPVSSSRDPRAFTCRYRNLRLVTQARDRPFLVPGTWSAQDFTLVLPMDGAVQLQFQFESRPP